MEIINNITFPKFTGIKCNMMPFIQGDPESLPEKYHTYYDIVKKNFLEQGKIGFLTIDENFVKQGESQRGFNSANINRNIHIEVGRYKNFNSWGSPKPTWGGRTNVTLEDDTKILIANNVSDTCRVFDDEETRYTENGDLTDYIEDYPIKDGKLLKSGQVAKINIFTPHEAVVQSESNKRQFFRIVGEGVKGKEQHFTYNPILKL